MASADATSRLCACGCGEQTSLARQTERKRGYVKGQPVRWVPGHNAKPTGPEYVERGCGHVSPCWVWLRSRNHLGYGSAGRGVWAHRMMYKRHIGPIPEGLELDHLCRNPSCVNPEHLEPVTHQENIRRAKHVKLTAHAAGWARVFAAMGFRKTDIADFYGCHVNTIHGVLRGETWADAPIPLEVV